MDDFELLRAYATKGNEAAFTTLTNRYVNLVYSAALRQVNDPHFAEEVTQVVFVLLARKSHTFREGVVLSGWLLRATRFTTTNVRVSQFRRIRREQIAVQMDTTPDDHAVWEQIAPFLDDALSQLGERDRNALALRFFEQKPLKEVGLALGIDPDTAQKRVARAVEKLRRLLVKRGVTLSALVITAALSAHAVQAAPAGIAASAATVAVVKGNLATSSTSTLIKTTLKLMAWTKLKTTAITGLVFLLLAGSATVAVKKTHQLYVEHKIIWAIDPRVLDKEPPVVLIRAAHPIPGVYSGGGGYVGSGGRMGGKMIGLKQSVESMLMLAYQSPSDSGGIHADRVVTSDKLPTGEYDFIASTLAFQKETLQQLLKKQFGLAARHETRDTNVLLLTLKNPRAPGLKISQSNSGGASEEKGRLVIKGGLISELANWLEDDWLGVPVLDQTGLTNAYDLELTWDAKGRDWRPPSREVLKRILLDQFGLELIPANQPVELLVIEKAK